MEQPKKDVKDIDPQDWKIIFDLIDRVKLSTEVIWKIEPLGESIYKVGLVDQASVDVLEEYREVIVNTQQKTVMPA